MKQIIRLVTLLLMVSTLTYAAPARGGVKVFTQPDGTTFSGVLKGDASFHWIESNSNVVLFNPNDNFYYNAKVTENGKLVLTDTKTHNSIKHSPALNSNAGKKIHSVSPSTHKVLMQIIKESKKGNYPR